MALYVTQIFEKMDEMARHGANEIGHRLSQAAQKNGVASLAVPGGSTPKKLLTHLSKLPITWKDVVVTLTDERWVDTDDPNSNEHMIRKTLLQDAARDCQFIGLKTPHDRPEEAESACAQILSRVPKPMDVVVLGMGNDGHVASLFPGEERGLALGFRPECLATQSPVAPFSRMSLSLSRILDSRWILLLISGEEKRRVFQAAMDGDPGLPITAVLNQERVPVYLFWCP